MKYSYSHEPNSGWIGEYDSAANALIAGRAIYGDDIRIFIARWTSGHYTDCFIGGDALIAYMRELAEGKELDVTAFDNLLKRPEFIAGLGAYVENAIGEWECDLPAEMQFTGTWIDQTRGYSQGEEVRPGHWS